MNALATPRAAYSLSEFARLFGRERTWAYRLVAAGKVRTITGFGKAMIPQSEVDRILSEGGAR
ncbi:MAG TPA: hypothetical protein VIM57_01180 [Luteolibacter sp.]